MSKTIILDKRRAVDIIFYDGENKNEVIEFFKDKPFGDYLTIIDNELHYKFQSWDKNTLIKPNHYLNFRYDEDSWWYILTETKESFENNYVSITI